MSSLEPIRIPPASPPTQLLNLVSEVVLSKPKTVAEASELFETLKMKLGIWLVSDLSVSEQKRFLAEQWIAEAVSSGCWTKRR
jgi:hypothetical protein